MTQLFYYKLVFLINLECILLITHCMIVLKCNFLLLLFYFQKFTLLKILTKVIAKEVCPIYKLQSKLSV